MSLINKIKEVKKLALAGILGLSSCSMGPDGKIYDLFGNEIGYQPRTSSNEQQRRDEKLLGLGLIGIGNSNEDYGTVAIGQSIVNYAGQEASKSEINIRVNPNVSSLKTYFLKDGILYDCQSKNKIMN